MDIHHLKIFYETCIAKGFSKAAKKLYISQSAVSIQIKKLESSLSAQLIDRSSRTFKLTPEGKELFKLSTEIFDRIYRMENEVKKLIKHGNNKIVIGATHNIGEPLLPLLLKHYSKYNEKMDFDIYIKNIDSIKHHLKNGVIDVALVEEDLTHEKGFKTVKTEVYPFVVIAPPHIRTMEEVKKLNVLSKDSAISKKYLDIFEGLIDFNFPKKNTVNGSNEAIKNLVMNGMGIGILPYYFVYEELQEKKLTQVHKFDELVDNFQLVYLSENENKENILDFTKFFKNYNIRLNPDNILKITK